MRKSILGALAGLSLAGALPALDLSLHGGYTSFNMGELNAANAKLIGYSAKPYSQPLDSGIVVGADLCGATPQPWLQWGLRTEFMQSNLAETKSIYVYYFTFTDQATLSDLLVGAKASQTLAGGLDLGLGLWAGYGYATLQQHSARNGIAQDGLYMASLPVAEFESSLAYRLGSHLKLSLSGGYRWANVGYLYNGDHAALYDNAVYWYYSGSWRSPIDVDYSGVTGQGSVSYSF